MTSSVENVNYSILYIIPNEQTSNQPFQFSSSSSRDDRFAEPSRRDRRRRAEHDERIQADTANGGSPGAVPGHHAQLHQGAAGRVDQLRGVRVLEPRPRREHDVIWCARSNPNQRDQHQRPECYR